MDRKLQRHRADSLRQHGFLVTIKIGLDWIGRYYSRDISASSAIEMCQ